MKKLFALVLVLSMVLVSVAFAESSPAVGSPTLSVEIVSAEVEGGDENDEEVKNFKAAVEADPGMVLVIVDLTEADKEKGDKEVAELIEKAYKQIDDQVASTGAFDLGNLPKVDSFGTIKNDLETEMNKFGATGTHNLGIYDIIEGDIQAPFTGILKEKGIKLWANVKFAPVIEKDVIIPIISYDAENWDVMVLGENFIIGEEGEFAFQVEDDPFVIIIAVM